MLYPFKGQKQGHNKKYKQCFIWHYTRKELPHVFGYEYNISIPFHGQFNPQDSLEDWPITAFDYKEIALKACHNKGHSTKNTKK